MTEITAGTQLGPYRIEALLGSGGMGRVYKARDTRLARDVAIKILPQDKLADADRKRRFLQEARAASALMHPNIVVVYDISSDAGMDFLVMEYVRGKTLQERLKPGALQPAEVARYGAQIASALAAAHAAGIVHRDIKPANIMITPESQAKVLDFGLAKLSEPAGIAPENETLTMAGVTEPGIVVGTVAYMSPEQTRGEPLDGSSDIFSLGCVLYEAATGRKPFQGLSVLAVMHEIATVNPAAPSVTNRNLPADFDRVIERALCKDKSERYDSATEMMEALQALESRPAFPAARRPANKRKGWLAAGVSALLVAAGFAAFQQWETRRGIDSIAVLPFTSNDREASMETLTDGLTEDLINRLTQAADLKVMAPATVFHYKGQSLDPRAIGRQLGVRAVLVGRISKSGDQAIVRGDLVNVNDGSQLWGKQYNRALSQLQSVGQEMAQEIADRVRPNGKGQPRLTKHHIADPLAYQLYLQGRRNIREYTEHGFRQSIVDFQNAVNRDPAYAAAWAGLADAYSYLAGFELQAPREAMPKAKDNAIKALELDSETAEAYTSLGIVALQYDWDWPLAERRFRRALALNPGDAYTHHWLGHYYESMGKWQDALRQMQRALDMDPLSPMFGEDLAWDLFTLGRYEEAARQLRKTVELAPQDPYARSLLALALEATGQNKQSLDEADKARHLPGMFVTAFSLSGVFCRLGKPEVAREILTQLQAAQKKSYVAPFEFAASHFALGDKKAGMDRLRDAVKERSGSIPLMVADPVFDSVRGDREFAALMTEVGLPEAAWSKVPRNSK